MTWSQQKEATHRQGGNREVRGSMGAEQVCVSTHRAVEQMLGSDPPTLGRTAQVKDAGTWEAN